MNRRKNILNLVKAVLGNKSRNWIAVYIDLLKMMDNVIKIHIENKALVVSSLVEALSGSLFSDSHLEGEPKIILSLKEQIRSFLIESKREDPAHNFYGQLSENEKDVFLHKAAI